MQEQLISALVALAIAIVGYITTILINRKNAVKIKNLEEFINSDETGYYVECPSCGQKIILNKVKILINKEQK